MYVEAPDVKEFRIVLERDGVRSKVALVTWSKRDASLYLIPYPTNAVGHVGVAPLATFDVADAGRPGSNPKVSIHQSGQTHARADGGISTKPLVGEPLTSPHGGHIATIYCGDPAGLPVLTGEPRKVPKPDFILLDRPEIGASALKVLIHVAPTERHLIERYNNPKFCVVMRRPNLTKPVFVGISPLIGGPVSGRGVTVLAGWGPGPSDQKVERVVFAATHGLEALPTDD